jgi:hypothetical protein
MISIEELFFHVIGIIREEYFIPHELAFFSNPL